VIQASCSLMPFYYGVRQDLLDFLLLEPGRSKFLHSQKKKMLIDLPLSCPFCSHRTYL